MSNLDCAYTTPSAQSIARFVADRFPYGPVTSRRLSQRGFNDLHGAGGWFDRLIEYLKNWESGYLSDPLVLS
jgi:hypothetical protein